MLFIPPSPKLLIPRSAARGTAAPIETDLSTEGRILTFSTAVK